MNAPVMKTLAYMTIERNVPHTWPSPAETPPVNSEIQPKDDPRMMPRINQGKDGSYPLALPITIPFSMVSYPLACLTW